jgi:hypothetical protein
MVSLWYSNPNCNCNIVFYRYPKLFLFGGKMSRVKTWYEADCFRAQRDVVRRWERNMNGIRILQVGNVD